MSQTIALPFSFVNGRVAVRSDSIDQLTDRVYSVLATQLGERVMRPSYGADLMQFDFGLGDDLDRAAMELEAQRAIALWEPNALVNSVTFDARPDQGGNLYATIDYQATGDTVGVVTQTILVGVLSGGQVTESGSPVSNDTVEGSTSLPVLANTQTRYFGAVE